MDYPRPVPTSGTPLYTPQGSPWEEERRRQLTFEWRIIWQEFEKRMWIMGLKILVLIFVGQLVLAGLCLLFVTGLDYWIN